MLSEIEYYKKLSKGVSSQEDKIEFFDQNQKAFYVDIYSGSWSKMIEAYAKLNNLNSDKLNKIEDMKWTEIPKGLKIFAYDFCIQNGFVFTGIDK